MSELDNYINMLEDMEDSSVEKLNEDLCDGAYKPDSQAIEYIEEPIQSSRVSPTKLSRKFGRRIGESGRGLSIDLKPIEPSI